MIGNTMQRSDISVRRTETVHNDRHRMRPRGT